MRRAIKPAYVSAALGVALSLFSLQIAAQSLQGRDLDGNPLNGHEAYYDQKYDLTWLNDAAFFDAVTPPNYLNWYQATGLVATAELYGISGWRLPKSSEIQDLYFTTLGNPRWPSPDQARYNLGPFTNVPVMPVWESDIFEDRYDGGIAGVFYLDMSENGQDTTSVFGSALPWPVRRGDVASVPEPSTAATALIALICLAALRRSCRNNLTTHQTRC